MQFAKPLVATRWRGIPDLVKDGVNGFLVEPGDATSLSKALIALIKDEKLRTVLGKNGMRSFRENYTTDVFRQNFQNAIRECVE